MPRTRAIRIVVIGVCAAGIVGMIVTSATNHNGAAVTFGLVTAVAVVCQMVATTVVNELTGAPGAPIAGPWTSAPAPPTVMPPTVVPPGPGVVVAADDPPAGVPPPAVSEEEAAEVEERIDALVRDGSDETAVRDLVRHAVRLGRGSATAAPPDS